MFHVEHLLPYAEPAEEGVEHIFGAGAADQGVQRAAGEAQVFRCKQRVVFPGGVIEALRDVAEQGVLALVERGFSGSGKRLAGVGDQRFAQGYHTFACAG